jgi:hypothetical protein
MALRENGRESELVKQFAAIRESLHTSLVMRSNRMTPADTSEWNKIIDQFVLLIDLCEQTQVLGDTSEVPKMADTIRKLLGSLKNHKLKEQIINDPRVAEKFRQVIVPAISLPYLRDLLMKDIPEPPPPSATDQEVQEVQSFAEESVGAIVEALSEKKEPPEPERKNSDITPIEDQIKKPLPKTTPVSSPSSSSHDEEVVIAPEVKEIPLPITEKSETYTAESLFDDEPPPQAEIPPSSPPQVEPTIAPPKIPRDTKKKTIADTIEELTKGKLQVIEDCLMEGLKNRSKDGHRIAIEMWITQEDGKIHPQIFQIRKLMAAEEKPKDTIVANYISGIGKLELEITTTCDPHTVKRLRLKIGALLVQKENYNTYGSYLLSD